MNDEFGQLMTKLDEPEPPASLKATVMARIARESEKQETPAAAVATARTQRGHDWNAWLCVVAGFCVVILMSGYGWLAEGALPDVASPRLGPVRVALIPDSPTVLIVGLGLLAYLAGLFAPLRSRGSA